MLHWFVGKFSHGVSNQLRNYRSLPLMTMAKITDVIPKVSSQLGDWLKLRKPTTLAVTGSSA